jgi:hypothetical protein
MSNYIEGFEKLVREPDLLTRVSETVGESADYPTAPQGLRVYWNTLCSYKGWKLQKNYYFHHCRILDENKVRRTRGGEKEMISALEAIVGKIKE